ncbi:MAG: exopolysaccharide biosynthesis protein [Alphaproteobacteria bacterium]|nr:exopolysaccharide biosynthesis protein [Alphaproteobacteria bacterium]
MTEHPRADRATIAGALQAVVDDTAGDDTSWGEILERLGGRGFGFAMLLLAAPNLTPGPSLPGFSTIFGAPMVLLALQMLGGAAGPRLPGFLARRRVARARLAAFMSKLVPIAARADRALRPRYPAVVALKSLHAMSFVVLALLLVLPFPFVSLAAAGAVVLIAVGLIAEDGIAVALGHASAVATVGLYAAFGWAALAALGWL